MRRPAALAALAVLLATAATAQGPGQVVQHLISQSGADTPDEPETVALGEPEQDRPDAAGAPSRTGKPAADHS